MENYNLLIPIYALMDYFEFDIESKIMNGVLLAKELVVYLENRVK